MNKRNGIGVVGLAFVVAMGVMGLSAGMVEPEAPEAWVLTCEDSQADYPAWEPGCIGYEVHCFDAAEEVCMIYGETLEFGKVPNTSVKPVAEDNLLISSLRVSPTRTKTTYPGEEGEDIGIRYRNPTLTFAFEGYIISESGLTIAHPGTEVSTLANFQGVLHGFDPTDGTMVFEDPVRDLQRGDASPYSFSVMHHPFVVDPA